jgi:DNA-binding transcriptional MerR regulator
MVKSPDAFRTISEVADWLGVEAHVLRFWETKFTQVKPVKRAGGRRYYRPSDMALLGGIRQLLHEDGLTIRGVQKLLREQGVGHVSAMSPELMVDGVELTRTARRRTGPVGEPSPQEAGGPEKGRRPVEADAPTLPFDLPHAPAPGPAETPRRDPPGPSHSGDGGARPHVLSLLHSRKARLDPGTAEPLLERARALAERLTGKPT